MNLGLNCVQQGPCWLADWVAAASALSLLQVQVCLLACCISDADLRARLCWVVASCSGGAAV